ncbi:MAG TPA: Gfo/Idh/MocA family oxidoreductase [Candidatus Hydrogenedentes bacterium]|nr:Gfo/Idh/MocA family oxidoreductase [Candidatus Hydrogenedentota bacterium]
MAVQTNRRGFLKASTAAALGTAVTGMAFGQNAPDAARVLRVGVVGVGGRGTGLLGILLGRKDVAVPAVCDINETHLNRALGMVEKAGQPKPEGYGSGEEAYKHLMERSDLDAVIIATPWNWHTPMAVHGMKCGKYVGVEVPAAMSFEECWALVNTHEETKVPCMMLENWSFRRDNLAVLRMIREGILGEIVHCHCAHSHDCIDHWFFDPQGNIRWGGEFLVRYNRDQYPTHSMGPVLSWMNINCGDAFATATSTATDSRAINAYFTRKFGADHPNAKRKYRQGDIVTTVVRTHLGKSIVINYDMQLPRPYDNRWMIQGTLGLYDEDKASVYIVDRSPKYHEWEPFAPYQEQYEHPWWKAMLGDSAARSHGGTDDLELAQFLDAVRNRTQTPIDVYDSVTMCSIIALSERSIALGSAPVECPDFTRGKWKTQAPRFALA